MTGLWAVRIAGFYSQTRHKVYFNYLKTFEDKTQKLLECFHNVQPKYYTRIGPVLRHAGETLSKQNNSKKFVLLISDCKPTDYDRYEGTHGFEDVKKVIQELEAQGVTCLVFSSHSESVAWLSDLFQSSQFRVFSSPQSFLEQFFDLFWLRLL